MTQQEATKIIEVAKSECEWNAPLDYQEAFDVAIKALEKQIPKEPAVMIDTWICPSCHNGIEYQFLLGDNVLFHGFHDFCPKCGQKIDWEEE